MSFDGRAPRLRLAVIVAPLFASLAIVLGAAVRQLATTGLHEVGATSLIGIVLLALILFVYGAPLAYGGTILILWPAAVLLRNAGSLSWWSLTLIGAVCGGLLFPVYLHAFDARATWGFFPAAGVAAGAATGWGFWFVATRGASSNHANERPRS
ncbi:MAG TPA: hypothetical protein VGQ44_18290 [Gemmatimonadaceae bacterium]|jgi:hypothetical protein|nr:hypothetical protein [Gemmatimonadaceae bacterium]